MYEVSNAADCARYGCDTYPWHWASNWVIEKSNFIAGDIVVDLGAGMNSITRAAAVRRSAYLILLDKFFSGTNAFDSGTCVVADMSTIPLASDSVDKVISVSALEHIPFASQAKTFREIWRILKPGGSAAVTFGHLFDADSEAEKLLTELPFFVDRGCPVYTPLDIRSAILGSGFDVRGLPDEADLKKLSKEKYIVEEWGDYNELESYPCLSNISHCEIGVLLRKIPNN